MNVIKKVAGFFLIPLTKWYLRKQRTFHFNGISVKVFPGVFHPGLFSSTLFLLEYLKEENLKNKKVLELGCGTGLIAIYSAREGANTIASDLNLKALENAALNIEQNSVSVKTIHSDLFDSIEKQIFDLIIINPPYYAAEVKSDEELAWNCGKNFEYFDKLFSQLSSFIDQKSEVIMVLTKGCDLYRITSIAQTHNFRFSLIKEKAVPFDERDYLFKIELNSFERRPV